MHSFSNALSLLPALDWAALAAYFLLWWGYAFYAKHPSVVERSLLAATNRERRLWMMQVTWRDVRVVDGVVVQSMSGSPSFFASTTILIIGGLLAVLGASEQASSVVREIPFAARTSGLVFDLKILLLTGVFVYAFFRFTWAVRLYSFGALLVGSAPAAERFAAEGPESPSREDFADRAGRVVGLAAESFNDGLRAYYLSFAAVAWFFSPWALMAATLGVILVLYRREFRSDVLAVLQERG